MGKAGSSRVVFAIPSSNQPITLFHALLFLERNYRRSQKPAKHRHFLLRVKVKWSNKIHEKKMFSSCSLLQYLVFGICTASLFNETLLISLFLSISLFPSHTQASKIL
jgi:hypothetical protein